MNLLKYHSFILESKYFHENVIFRNDFEADMTIRDEMYTYTTLSYCFQEDFYQSMYNKDGKVLINFRIFIYILLRFQLRYQSHDFSIPLQPSDVLGKLHFEK